MRRLGRYFQLTHRFAPLPYAGADAIISGIAAADYNHVFAPGVDLANRLFAYYSPCCIRKEIDGKAYPFSRNIASGKGARLFGAGAYYCRVKFGYELFRVLIRSDIGAANEFDPFAFH